EGIARVRVSSSAEGAPDVSTVDDAPERIVAVPEPPRPPPVHENVLTTEMPAAPFSVPPVSFSVVNRDTRDVLVRVSVPLVTCSAAPAAACTDCTDVGSGTENWTVTPGVPMQTWSVEVGSRSGFQFAASPQFDVPAPPSQVIVAVPAEQLVTAPAGAAERKAMAAGRSSNSRR